MFKSQRRKLFADRKVQGTLAARLVTYWCFTWLIVLALAMAVAAFFGMIVEGVGTWQLVQSMMSYLWFPLLISVMVLPILVKDCLKLSNRFAGPVLRFRRGMKQLADGEPAQPVKLRDGDFWQDLADDFNRLLARVQPASESGESQT